jgi:MFS family permease
VIILKAAGQAKVEKATEVGWAVLNALFTVGGMLGAIGSKYIMDFLGRKQGILFHNLFSLSGALLVILAPYVRSPVCLFLSRFLFGVQSGATCSITPTYINEISPKELRGQTGVLPQLGIVTGILLAQVLGFKELLGTDSYWQFLLATPLVPALLSSLFIFLFFPESPSELLKEDEHKAKEGNPQEKEPLLQKEYSY